MVEERLTLPSWFKPDNSSGDKGQLLYLEDWAKKRRFEEPYFIILALFVEALGIFSFMVGVISIFTGDFGAVVVFGVLAICIIGIGYVMLWCSLQVMPFAIYEKGFTQIYVHYKQGWKRKETFIPWERLDKVQLEEESLDDVKTWAVREYYDRKEVQTLKSYDVFQVMRLFRRFVPGKMNKSFELFLGEEEERLIIDDPNPDISITRSWPFLLILNELFLVVVVTLLYLNLTEKVDLFLSILIASLFAPLLANFPPFFFKYDREDQLNLMEKKVKYGPSGISIPRTEFGKRFKKVRYFIPWCEISVVRMKLDYKYYHRKAEIETTLGDRFMVPFSIYEGVSEKEGFTKKDWDYFNVKPVKNCEPLEGRSLIHSLLFSMLVISPGLIVLLIWILLDYLFL